MAKRKLAPVDVAKRQSTLLVLFIPSTDRAGREIDQMPWVDKMLSILGELFGGATAFPRGRGVWRDDAQRGNLVFDDPVVINCYTNDDSILEQSPALVRLLKEMGQATKQGAVGFVIDKTYYEISFPLETSS